MTLIDTATPEQIALSFDESELAGYKMDRPFDHNGFRESAPGLP